MSHNLELVIESERRREQTPLRRQEYTYEEAMTLCRSGYCVKPASETMSRTYLLAKGLGIFIYRDFGQELEPYTFYPEHLDLKWVIVQVH